jgi:hypothetical protein
VVENATGGDGDDVLYGNAADNVLTGGAGSNILYGGAGADTAMVAAGATVYKDRHHGTFHASGPSGEDVLVGVEHVYVGGVAHTRNYAGGEQWITLVSGTQALHLKQHGTGSSTMEAHVMAADGQSWALQTPTLLEQTYGTWQFAVQPGTGNLACFKLSKTGSGRTEVHVLSAASNYASWVQQATTALEEVQHSWQLAMLPNGDVVGIKKAATGSGQTEVHVLSASAGYQSFSLQTATALEATGAHFEFLVAPDNGDLVAIKKQHTGSGKTELHVLSAASGYQSFALQTATALEEADDSWHFGMDASRHLWAFKKKGTGCGKMEIHSLSSSSGYQTFVQQTCTVLEEAA